MLINILVDYLTIQTLKWLNKKKALNVCSFNLYFTHKLKLVYITPNCDPQTSLNIIFPAVF